MSCWTVLQDLEIWSETIDTSLSCHICWRKLELKNIEDPGSLAHITACFIEAGRLFHEFSMWMMRPKRQTSFQPLLWCWHVPWLKIHPSKLNDLWKGPWSYQRAHALSSSWSECVSVHQTISLHPEAHIPNFYLYQSATPTPTQTPTNSARQDGMVSVNPTYRCLARALAPVSAGNSPSPRQSRSLHISCKIGGWILNWRRGRHGRRMRSVWWGLVLIRVLHFQWGQSGLRWSGGDS